MSGILSGISMKRREKGKYGNEWKGGKENAREKRGREKDNTIEKLGRKVGRKGRNGKKM